MNEKGYVAFIVALLLVVGGFGVYMLMANSDTPVENDSPVGSWYASYTEMIDYDPVPSVESKSFVYTNSQLSLRIYSCYDTVVQGTITNHSSLHKSHNFSGSYHDGWMQAFVVSDDIDFAVYLDGHMSGNTFEIICTFYSQTETGHDYETNGMIIFTRSGCSPEPVKQLYSFNMNYKHQRSEAVAYNRLPVEVKQPIEMNFLMEKKRLAILEVRIGDQIEYMGIASQYVDDDGRGYATGGMLVNGASSYSHFVFYDSKLSVTMETESPAGFFTMCSGYDVGAYFGGITYGSMTLDGHYVGNMYLVKNGVSTCISQVTLDFDHICHHTSQGLLTGDFGSVKLMGYNLGGDNCDVVFFDKAEISSFNGKQSMNSLVISGSITGPDDVRYELKIVATLG